jgi:hypothetical protein
MRTSPGWVFIPKAYKLTTTIAVAEYRLSELDIQSGAKKRFLLVIPDSEAHPDKMK